MGRRCLQPSRPFLDDSTINLQNDAAQIGNTGELLYSLQANASSSILRSFEQELDETKNFRAEEVLETARSNENTATTSTEQSDQNRRSTTLLREHDSDNDDNGYVTTFEYPVKSTQTWKINGLLRTSL